MSIGTNRSNKDSRLDSSSSSNVLRRMFKSKSKTRTNSSSNVNNINSNPNPNNNNNNHQSHHNTNQNHYNHHSHHHSSQKRHQSIVPYAFNSISPLQIDLLENQFALFLNPTHIFSIDAFEQFLADSRPAIVGDKVISRNNNDDGGGEADEELTVEAGKNVEIVNLYLQSLSFQSREQKRRSKLDQHRMEKRLSLEKEEESSGAGVYYFVKCKLSVDALGNNEFEHLTRLFKSTEPINELFQVRINE